MKFSWTAACLVLLAPALVGAQDLGEAAEKEKARRRGGAKAYSNEDLDKGKPSPSPSPSPTAAPAATQPAPSGPAASRRTRFKVPTTPSPPPAGGTSSGAAEPPPSSEPSESEAGEREPAKNEAYWRGQREARQNAIRGAEERIKAIQARMAELSSDLNPQAADVMDPDRLRKRDIELREKADELVQAREALAAARANLANLDEEARRAGVPPGWVR
jgi:hypothetical protein